MKWPNLFVVGVARGGTSSLWDYLHQHPDVWMSRLKEPYFFSVAQMRYHPFPKDERAYLSLFSDAGDATWRGEASTAYFWDETSPHKIRNASPDARVVISLRDPVARAYSGYWHAVRYAGERRTFLDVVHAELEASHQPGQPPGHVAAGRYAAGLERYMTLFEGQLYTLFFENLVRHPRDEMRKLFRFLETDVAVADRLEVVRRNASRAPRSPSLERLLTAGRIRRIGRTVVPARVRESIESLAWAGGVPPLQQEARQLLEQVYRPERPRLERLLGRPLPW